MTIATHNDPLFPQTALRAPGEVMRLDRMGAFFPTRLSFMRTLIRRLAQEQAVVSRPVWEINREGFGHAVYSLSLSGHVYSLIAFSTALPEDKRTDRVIAEAWDSSYVLFDGVPTDADIARLKINTPKQEAGRFQAQDLILSRANKSVRLFDHVVESLAAGRQPDQSMLLSIGYLMRTTAVYGNGKFGIADRSRIEDRPGLKGPFQAEMLTVWLIRGFTHDLVEHVASLKSPETFSPLDPDSKRYLGIGNATGLGMAPFLVSHPILINNWMLVRETALARVRAIPTAEEATVQAIRQLMERAKRHLDQWNVIDAIQMAKIEKLRAEFSSVMDLMTPSWLREPNPWDRLVRDVSSLSFECQELVVALVLEPHGSLIDGLTDCMASDQIPQLNPAMSLDQLKSVLTGNYDWALKVDLSSQEETRLFWYVSEEKLEPRLGDRYEEAGAELEMPFDICRQVQELRRDLEELPGENSVAELLLQHPHYRHMVRRIQCSEKYPYSEIHDNLIAANCLPINMLRCKLSFFGASKFDPKSDRWTRITLYQGAPLFDELHGRDADDWWLPVFGAVS
ncbi:hypothetical protein NBZ79_15995 [Sneathiella marina]|uniref:Uncharacterized protein n=1 Tax=Sneathiella marina TaxID=2950108 RepID=A0ABY4W3G9_9PROT|nr:hypothetical protein [Sneathiella marina]USG60668.1 hypothetical protein NBZ79_15995 [Sneathiella marina]